MSPESNQPSPEQPELITGVPAELGGEEVRAQAEADAAARKEERKDVIGLHTNIRSVTPPDFEQHPEQSDGQAADSETTQL